MPQYISKYTIHHMPYYMIVYVHNTILHRHMAYYIIVYADVIYRAVHHMIAVLCWMAGYGVWRPAAGRASCCSWSEARRAPCCCSAAARLAPHLLFVIKIYL